MAKRVAPSIRETAFDCPHCGAFTTQYWFKIYAEQVSGKERLARIPNSGFLERLQGIKDLTDDDKKPLINWYNKMALGLVFFEEKGHYADFDVNNLHLSKCYNCGKIAVWVHDNMVFPHEKQGVPPNQDLPDDIVKDFEEARSIVGLSPRGAAALLRLCIQKLCMHLGEKGRNIDDDIASLVKKGLDPLVQQSLDIVRVIGNEAVHPGVIDLNDDRDTANRLFDLINSIADQMISHPKSIAELYEKLPPDKRKAIEKRNGRS